MVANRAVARRSGEQNPAYEPAHPHLGLWPGRLSLSPPTWPGHRCPARAGGRLGSSCGAKSTRSTVRPKSSPRRIRSDLLDIPARLLTRLWRARYLVRRVRSAAV